MILDFLKIKSKGQIQASKNQSIYKKTLELCVVCGAVTDVEVETPINERKCYVPCAGQLCRKCCMEIYGTEELKSLQDSDVEQMFF